MTIGRFYLVKALKTGSSLMECALKPLAKSALTPLGLTTSSAIDTAIQLFSRKYLDLVSPY